MKKHIKYNLLEAHLRCRDFRHAQEVMKDLRIKYEHSTPQSIAETWIFWNCTNIPKLKRLPSYLKVVDLDPMEWIGYGLSEEKAKELSI